MRIASLVRFFPKVCASLLTVVGCACAGLPAGMPLGSKLPATRPADFQISVHEDGGMMPRGESVQISANESSYDVFRNDVRVVAQFTSTAAELDELYRIVRENNPDGIRTHQEKVYDRGGTSLQITVDGRVLNISNSGISFVEKGSATQFNAIVAAVKARLVCTAPDPTVVEIFWGDRRFSGGRIEISAGDQFAGMQIGDDQQVRVTLAKPIRLPIRVVASGEKIQGSLEIDTSKTRRVAIAIEGGKVAITPE